MQESGEMYLETILRLSLLKDKVRAIDVSEEMGFSKPSVSRGLSILKREGYLTVEENGALQLTEAGKAKAQSVYDRHLALTEFFTRIGVSEERAVDDACRVEHVISDETFEALKEHLKKL